MPRSFSLTANDAAECRRGLQWAAWTNITKPFSRGSAGPGSPFTVQLHRLRLTSWKKRNADLASANER